MLFVQGRSVFEDVMEATAADADDAAAATSFGVSPIKPSSPVKTGSTTLKLSEAFPPNDSRSAWWQNGSAQVK